MELPQLLEDPWRHRWALRQHLHEGEPTPQELRAILVAMVRADPGAFWREICALLWSRVPRAEAADTFGELRYQLQTRHPTFVPYLPREQARQLLEAGPDLRYGLFRHLDLGHQALTRGHLEQLTQHRCFQAVEGLVLRHTKLPPEAFGVLFGASFWHLRRLDLSYNGLGLESIQALVGASYFGQLTQLELTCTGLRAASVGALAQGRSGRLRTLSLEHNRPGSAGAQALAHAGWSSLERLELGHAWLGADQALDALVSGPLLASVSSLGLQHNELGPAQLERFVRHPVIAGLEALQLRRNPLEDEGARILASSTSLHVLRQLDLSSCGVGDDGAAALGGSGTLAPVSLSLRGNRFGEIGGRALVASGLLSRTECLDLSHNAVGPETAVALASSPHTHALAQLVLSGNPVGDAGISALISAERLGRLRELRLDGCALTRVGLRCLAQSQQLAGIQRLWIGGNDLSDEAVIELVRSPHARNLELLSLAELPVSGAVGHAIAQADHLRRLEHLELLHTEIDEAAAVAMVRAEHTTEGLKDALRAAYLLED